MQHYTSRAIEERNALRRVEEGKVQDLQQRNRNEMLIASNCRSDERVEAMRRARAREQQAAEMYQDWKIEHDRQEQEKKQILEEQSKKLASELQRRNDEDSRHQALVRQICESSDELKELQQKLKAAGINRERELQQQYHEQKLAQDKAAESALEKKNEAEVKEALRNAELVEYERRLKKVKEREELDAQVRERERLRQAEEQAIFEKHKREIDEAVARVQAEDAAELEARRQKKLETQKMIQEYEAQRTAWRAEQKRMEDEEVKRMLEYQKYTSDKIAKLEAERKKKRAEDDRIYQQVVKEIQENRRKQEETEQLLADLAWEEAEAERALSLQRDDERKAKMQADIRSAAEFQKAAKAKRLEEEKRQEEEYRKQMLAKFAEDERLERLSKEARRQRQLDLKKQIDDMLAQKRALAEHERQEEDNRQAALKKEEAFRKRVIEEERLRLLREHASQLASYLPKGVIKTEQEFEIVFGKKPEMPVAASPVPAAVLLGGLHA